MAMRVFEANSCWTCLVGRMGVGKRRRWDVAGE